MTANTPTTSAEDNRTITLSEDTFYTLRRIARKDKTSWSNLVRKVVSDYVDSRITEPKKEA